MIYIGFGIHYAYSLSLPKWGTNQVQSFWLRVRYPLSLISVLGERRHIDLLADEIVVGCASGVYGRLLGTLE